MSEQRPLVIEALTKTCDAHPSQWEGLTAPCSCCGAQKAVHIRYRRSWLRVGVGRTLDEAIMADSAFEWQGDDLLDGYLDLAGLREKLPAWITLPEAEVDETPLEEAR